LTNSGGGGFWQLYTIDEKNQAKTTFVGNTGIPSIGGSAGLAIDSSGRLFAAVSAAGGRSDLYEIDLKNIGTPISKPLAIGFTNVTGIAFDKSTAKTVASPPDAADSSDKATSLGVLTTSYTLLGADTRRHANGKFDDDWYAVTAGKNGTLSACIGNINVICSGPKGKSKFGDLHFRVYRVVDGNLIQLGASQSSGSKTIDVPVAQGERILVWVYGLYFTQATYDLNVSLR
jgi:hypothetical protein